MTDGRIRVASQPGLFQSAGSSQIKSWSPNSGVSWRGRLARGADPLLRRASAPTEPLPRPVERNRTAVLAGRPVPSLSLEEAAHGMHQLLASTVRAILAREGRSPCLSPAASTAEHCSPVRSRCATSSSISPSSM